MSLVSFMEMVRKGINTLRKNSDAKTLLVTHYDTDGLTSGYIFSKVLESMGIDFDIQIVPFISKINIDSIPTDYDMYVFSDIGSGQIDIIEPHLNGKTIVVFDHHPYEIKPANALIVNPTDFGYDSQSDMCAAGLAYTAYRFVNGFNEKILWIAITGTVGDVQDAGNNIKGLNREILLRDVERKSEYIFYDEDLPRAPYLFTRPLWYIITYNYILTVPGLYQNKDKTIEELVNAGFNPRIKVTDLPPGEQRMFFNWIKKKLIEGGESLEGKFGEFVNLRYEPDDIRYHARTFATYINATGRLERYNEVFKSFENDDVTALLYGSEDSKAEMRKLQSIIENADVMQSDNVAVAVIDGVSPWFSGLAANILSSKTGKVGVVAIKGDDYYKVSGRAQGKPPFKIGELFREIAEKYNLDGGGHENAGGIVVPDKEDYMNKVVKELLKK